MISIFNSLFNLKRYKWKGRENQMLKATFIPDGQVTLCQCIVLIKKTHVIFILFSLKQGYVTFLEQGPDRMTC